MAQLEIPVRDDPTGARDLAIESAHLAFDDGANVVVLPELAVPGYTTDPACLAQLAEPVPGPTTTALAELAGAADALIVVGLAEADDGRFFNTAVAVTGDGVVAHYRKLHLFDREKHVFAPGDRGLPVVTTPFGRIGLCICYDLRFPEVARILGLQGADMILAPAAWVRGFDPVPSAVPAQVQGVIVQANLDQVFIACASQVGTPGPHCFLGSSVVVDPFGEVVLGPLSPDRAAIETLDLDLDRCAAAQRRTDLVTPRADRRTDVYGITYGEQRL